MKKQMFWTLALICLCLVLLSPGAHAAETVASGSCGENLTWTLDDSGTLTISGTGKMDNYEPYLFGVTPPEVAPPWFAYTASITRVVLEDGVTNIGGYAFYGCASLTEITIPDSVSLIDIYAFSECASLTGATIGRGVTTIEFAAFSYCPNLTDITFLGNAPGYIGNFFSQGRITAHYSKDDPTWTAEMIASYPRDVIWNACDLECEHTLDAGTTQEATCTEPGFTRYTCQCGYVHYTYTTQPLGHQVVFDQLDPTCTEGGYRVDKCAVCGITLQEYQWGPTGHSYEGDNCTGCGEKKPEWLVDQGRCGVDVIWVLSKDGTLTISGTGGINHYDVSYTSDNTPWADYKQQITAIIVEEGVTGIGRSAFENCAALTAVTLADTVKIISERAFKNCGKLSRLELGNGLRTLEKEAFSLCKSLVEVTLPDSLNTLGELVFSYCESLVGIFVPNNVPSLGRRAFYECASLAYISMPDTITGIDGETFSWCEMLHHVFYRGNRTDIYTPHGPAIPNQYFRNATKHYGCTGDEIQMQRTEATCLAQGAILFTCALCEDTFGSTLPQLPHNWQDVTCTAPRTCSICSTTMGADLGGEHTWGEGIVVQEPVDNQPGVMQYTCSVCGETKVELMEPTPETPDTPEEPVSGGTRFLILIAALVVVIGGVAAVIALRQRKA